MRVILTAGEMAKARAALDAWNADDDTKDWPLDVLAEIAPTLSGLSDDDCATQLQLLVDLAEVEG
jgi:hypothetical protein